LLGASTFAIFICFSFKIIQVISEFQLLMPSVEWMSSSSHWYCRRTSLSGLQYPPSSRGFIDHKRSPSLIASIDVSHSRHTSKARTFSSYPSLFDVEEMRPYHSQKTVDRSFVEACKLEFRPAFQILSSLSKLTCASQP